MKTKKDLIVAIVVIFGICFFTAFLSTQRMDSKGMADPKNPSINERVFSEQSE